MQAPETPPALGAFFDASSPDERRANAALAQFVVLTTPQGANRVYRAPAEFPEQQPGGLWLIDVDGRRWRISETALVLQADQRVEAPRMSTQRAFWFGWHAQFPQTILIK